MCSRLKPKAGNFRTKSIDSTRPTRGNIHTTPSLLAISMAIAPPMTHRLPTELWLHIFYILRESDRPRFERVKNIKAASETCRIFHQIAQPLMLERVTFDGKCGNDARGNASLHALLGLLERSEERREWVREALVCFWIRERPSLLQNRKDQSESHVFLPGFDRLERVLLKLERLHTLAMVLTPVTGEIVRHACNAPSLRRLMLMNTKTMSPLPFVPHQVASNATEIVLLSQRWELFTETDDAVRLLFLPNLRSLKIDPRDFPRLARLANNPFQLKPPPITKLSVRGRSGNPIYLDQLLAFLRSCPTIEELEIEGSVVDDVRVRDRAVVKPPMPNLRRFHGSPAITWAFCGAELDALSLVAPCHLLSRDTLSAFPPSFRHLSVGEVLWHGELLIGIAERCPRLETLVVHIRAQHAPEPEWLEDNLPEVVNAVPQLKSFVFVAGSTVTSYIKRDEGRPGAFCQQLDETIIRQLELLGHGLEETHYMSGRRWLLVGHGWRVMQGNCTPRRGHGERITSSIVF
ncbi:hypothetical protein FRB99_005835 [Tulasnella sp. 403]|nr:hypothetical protein FRB99_005835 [Tulasnella sp. 403]